MAESILPGVYIEVRAEGLIAPGQITVGNLGVVGTASKGELDEPTLISSYADARQKFGAYNSFIDPVTKKRRIDDTDPKKPPNELTLVRALEQAFAFGASTVFAVRVAGADKAKASYVVKSATGDCVKLEAKTFGEWANDLSINIFDAEEDAFIEGESVPSSGAGALTLKRTDTVKSARNRVIHVVDATGVTRVIGGANILYGGGLPDDDAGVPATGQIKIDRASGVITFPASDAPAVADTITASYVVQKAKAVKVTLRLGASDEVYTVVDGKDLAADINELSAWVDATVQANSGEVPTKSASDATFAAFKGGDNGQNGANYKAGLDALLNEDAHIIIGAGQDDRFGNELDKHCQKASTDVIKRDRIAVVGSRPRTDFADDDKFLDYLRGHSLASDRVIFVGPGMQAKDTATDPPADVILPGAYAAAAVAGLLSSFSAHISPTNKVLAVDNLETNFSAPELTQLVQNRVLALEKRQGFRIVKGITTSTNTAFAQVTTRRIVDFAKFAVRSAAASYIGLLNNERVRAALKSTVISALQAMLDDEMLTFFKVDVTATRQEEIKGIARVTITLQPTFSIDFIKVTMFLQ